jgi:hypothetical protein
MATNLTFESSTITFVGGNVYYITQPSPYCVFPHIATIYSSIKSTIFCTGRFLFRYVSIFRLSFIVLNIFESVLRAAIRTGRTGFTSAV